MKKRILSMFLALSVVLSVVVMPDGWSLRAAATTATINAGTTPWLLNNIPASALTDLELGSNISVIQLRVPGTATSEDIPLSIGTGLSAVLTQYDTATEQFVIVSSITVRADGRATANVARTGEYLVFGFKTGDVTGDGAVDTADALEVLRSAVGLIELNSVKSFIAKGNTGEISTSDALNILRYAVGLVDRI